MPNPECRVEDLEKEIEFIDGELSGLLETGMWEYSGAEAMDAIASTIRSILNREGRYASIDR